MSQTLRCDEEERERARRGHVSVFAEDADRCETGVPASPSKDGA